jgi:hypothetical protein
MKRFTYSVAMRDKQCECLDVQSVVSFINSELGCDLVSSNMVFNYFCRPHVVNKKIFGGLVTLSRTAIKPASNCLHSHIEAPADSPSLGCMGP